MWRFFDLFRKLKVKPTVLNARVCEDCTRVAEEACGAGWEFMGHACDQMPMRSDDGPKGMMAVAIHPYTAKAGRPGRSWRSSIAGASTAACRVSAWFDVQPLQS